MSKILTNRALCRLKLGKPSAAVDDCEAALRAQPVGNWKALFRLALAQYDLFRFEDAFRSAQQVVQGALVPAALPGEALPGEALPGEAPAATPPAADLVRAAQALANEVGPLRRRYRAPQMSALEKRTMFSEHHTLRVHLQDISVAGTYVLRAGARASVQAQLFIGNEFGLFLGSHVEQPLGLVVALLDATAGGAPLAADVAQSVATFSEHGRATVAVSFNVSAAWAGRLVHLRFATSLGKIVPVMSLPLLVLGEREREEAAPPLFYVGRGIEFTCCRELQFPGAAVQLLEASAQLGIPGKLWDGGSRLLEFLAAPGCPVSLRGCSLWELGAGTGALGIGAAQLGCRKVVVSDLPEVLPQMEANVQLNARSGRLAGCEVAAKVCCWGDAAQAPAGADLLLFADCIYDPDFYDALLATLLCATAGAAAATTRVLWGHRHRNPEDHKFFVQMDAHFETRLLCGPGARFLVQACPPELLQLARRFGGDGEQQPDAPEALQGAREQDHRSDDVSVYVSTRRERCPRA